MKLTNLNQMPPGGYEYYEPTLNWHMPRATAMIGLREAVEALRTVRAQNPASGLDPSYEAAVEAIGAYTCARFERYPEIQARYCSPLPEFKEEVAESGKARRGRPCPSCGGGRRR